MREGIRLFVITEIERFPIFHQVHGIGSQTYKNDFHKEEIKTFPDKDQIDVSCQENYQK